MTTIVPTELNFELRLSDRGAPNLPIIQELLVERD
jgi:hypothetical protein